MIPTKEEAYKKIAELVERFEEQLPSYKQSAYNETLTRKDFIDPFFKALGWDMDNSNGYAEAYREVIHEDKLKIGSATKAPDYSFRLSGGKRLFFVEAKKPSVAVKDDILPAYQVRRYGWSAKMPISIITDFEEFSVYDCTKKPLPADKASVSRIRYITFRDYLKEFDFIWDTFSKERVLKGSFDKFVQSDTYKKGTATVDKEFLHSLDQWRTYLATSISWRNKDLNEDEINFAVQQTIDRIIFLRIAEDRGVELYGNLKNAIKSGDYYQNLFAIFREADDKYNSGLFDFVRDRISETLQIDNKVVKTIINELYYPESPYEFSVLSVEILGSAYEQFLGKQIKIDKAHRAHIEEKPEVRKAGGVYYTPQYIVEYIVKNTVGKLAENKTPEEVSKLKIVDPACGSGSFLIGAYGYLLDWHKDYYSFHLLTKKKRAEVLTPEGNLTSAEKKRILLNNIYGVDIDVNAVEVTKLSLLLKCMEGETKASIEHQMSMFKERVLPSLENNIKCGNSLIDTNYYDNQLDFGEEKKIKPFNWQKAFPEVFKQGGFDAVIGNPPYLRFQGLKETQSELINYYKKNFNSAISGNFDLYVLFIEKGFKLLNSNGRLGLILPHKFFQADFGVGIRNYITNENALSHILHFGSAQVFEDATTYVCLLFLDKLKKNKVSISIVEDTEEFATIGKIDKSFVSVLPVVNEKWNFHSEANQLLLDKLKLKNKTLQDITRKIFVGLQTSSDKIYVLKIIEERENTYLTNSKSLDTDIEIEKGLVKPFLMGKDIKRYQPLNPSHVVVFPYLVNDGSAKLMPADYVKNNYPLGWQYILRNKKELEEREKGKMKGDRFYAYIYPKNLAEFETIKICTPDISDQTNFTKDIKGKLYHTTTVYSFVFKDNIKENINYFLAILNTPLLWYYMKKTGNILRGGFFRFKTEYLKPFPVRLIDLNDRDEKNKHDEIVNLVDQLLQLNEELQNVKLATQREQIQNKIDYCENHINKIVYELYGLTEEEMAIIENSIK